MIERHYPTRRSNRLKNYDYSSEGLYFITICTQGRACILSQIKNDVGDGFPVPHLTFIGEYVKKYIELVNDKYPNVFIDKYIIMPNHIHLLIYIGNTDDIKAPTVGNVIGWLKYAITKQFNSDMNTNQRIFQRSYHDHIIRNEKSYIVISDYIEKNPQVWEQDCFYISEIQ